MKRIVFGLLAAVVSMLMATEAMATRGLYLHAYGTRATGLGGAFDAVSDDGISAVAYNPAGLTQIEEKRFDLDLVFLRTYLNFRNRDNLPQNGQNGVATSAQGFIPGYDPFSKTGQGPYLPLNNDADNRTAKNNYFIMGGMGFGMRINENLVFGTGFVGRGGGGSYYKINQSPFSFILPNDDAEGFLPVPLATTRRGPISMQGTATLPITDSAGGTTPSSRAFYVSTEYSTDLKIPELGPAIAYEVNDYLSVGLSARVVAGDFSFKQALGTDATIMKGTGQFSDDTWLGGAADRASASTYGEILSGKRRDPQLGSVQFGYPELQGIGRLEDATAAGLGWGAGIHYRPYGFNKLVLSVSYKSRATMDFESGTMMMDLSDQFRKFYYDIGQFGDYNTVTYGQPWVAGDPSYLSNGPQIMRAPNLFNALLGTIDHPARKGNVQAQQAMEWFFNGVTKDGRPTLERDPNGYVRSINLTAHYDPYIQFTLPRELAFGAAWRPVEPLLLSLEYRLIYMEDLVGDYFSMDLGDGNSPFFDWMLGVQNGQDFSFAMHTDFDTIRSVSLGAEYDLGDRWIIRGGVQHSENTFPGGDHLPFTFNMQPEDEFSGGCTYRVNDNWQLSFAGSVAFTWDTTESKGTEKTGSNYFDSDFANNSSFHKGSEIDQFHSSAEFDQKQWQLNFGLAYTWW